MFFWVLIFFVTSYQGQNCSSCNTVISSYDTLSYTIENGQTFCIDSTGNFQGAIILNGGTICNKGYFNPENITFNSGTIDNYGNATIPITLLLGASKVINNKTDAIINFFGDLTLNGGTFTNYGISNITQNLTNSSGSITNAGILNCLQVIGVNVLNNSGVINTN